MEYCANCQEMMMQLREMPLSFQGFPAEPFLPRTPLDTPFAVPPEEAQAMQRAIIRLFDHWGIGDQDASVLLGDLSPRTYQRWKTGQYGRAGVDLITRMSNLIGIHKALRLIFADPVRGYDWVRAANSAFSGQSALAVMLGGQITDLMRVRRYLDAQRGAW
jgi:Protein of unknown function (DUF2384)